MLKIGNRLFFRFFNISISFCISKGCKNKYVTLGTNCFPRTKLVKFGIKSKKKYGELSYPFDLCMCQIEAIDKILSNNFADFFDDILFNQDLNIWENKKYAIKFWHDRNISKDFFIERYKKRINNFSNITKNYENLIFISVIFNQKYNSDLYISIYNSLNKYCTYNFKYLVVNIVKDKSQIDLKNINKNIYYSEITQPIENYSEIWTNHQLDKLYPDKMMNFYKQYISCVNQI